MLSFFSDLRRALQTRPHQGEIFRRAAYFIHEGAGVYQFFGTPLQFSDKINTFPNRFFHFLGYPTDQKTPKDRSYAD